MAMDILKQCQTWHENDEHQKIVDALEAIPDAERGADIDMELARAYNNLADPSGPARRNWETPIPGTSGWGMPGIIWTRRAGPCPISARRWNCTPATTPNTTPGRRSNR